MRERGFTLVEILVSVMIFSIVMLIAVGALLSMLDANRKAQVLKSSINNLSFALENMSRQMRAGSSYHCGTGTLTEPLDCINGASQFAFEKYGGNPASANDQVVYRLSNNRIERSLDGGAVYLPITAPEVVVEELMFYVVGAPPTDSPKEQPKVIITMRGYAGENQRIRTEVRLETMVTQRTLDE
jgi:prepilin-type N-terminal cleavage/methylation domain-containing protein